MRRFLAIAIVCWVGCVEAAALGRLSAPREGARRYTGAPGQTFAWRLPAGFPLPIAGANAQNEEKFQLGRRLFYDRRLSANGTESCASCHQQKRAFSDGRPHAIGSTGQEHTLNAMTLTNVAYNASYTWQNLRVRSLEKQAVVPMFNEHPIELGVKGHEKEVLARLYADPNYPAMFEAAFAGERRPISIANIGRALASFERALISGHSAYDRLVYGGDEHALSDSAWRGMQIFFSERAGCSSCHRGFNFSGAVRYAGGKAQKPSLTSNGITTGQFRIPTLRNAALTAPYMHDGSIATLAEVVDRYSATRGLKLSDAEKSDLVAFLQSLTDEQFVNDPRFAEPR